MSTNSRNYTKALYGFDAVVQRVPADRWDAPSPCEGWCARDVVAHASGVVDAHLSDDFFLEYTHIVTPNFFLTGGFSISIPGGGIKEAAGGDAPIWTGAFLNAVINY